MSSTYPPSYRPPSSSPNPPSSFQPAHPYQSQSSSTSPSRSPQPPYAPQSYKPYSQPYSSQYNPTQYNAPYSGGPPGSVPPAAAAGAASVGRYGAGSGAVGMGNLSPDEDEDVDDGGSFVDWNKMKSWRFWIRKEWIVWYILGLVLIVLTALMTIYHTQIVNWLKPAATWMRDLPAGWTIPVVILFVISFPPLFGHEIVAVLCGVVWGLWIGFGIVALGTFLGEIGNFYAFKYCCRARSEKHEKSTPWYACLARVVREGGFKVALIVRLSAIPGHFTTAVFATCGMSIWVFCLAAALSLPKQFVTVYLGYILEQSGDSTEPTSSRIISDVIVAVSVLITIAAGWYILRKMKQVRPQVMREIRRAKRAQAEFGGAAYGGYKAPAGGAEAGGSAENLWSSDFNASEMTLAGPGAAGGAGAGAGAGEGRKSPVANVQVRPYSPAYDLPPGAAPPAHFSAPGSAPNSGRNTPRSHAPGLSVDTSLPVGAGAAGTGRRYAPPSQSQYPASLPQGGASASADDLAMEMEPIRAAPGSLDAHVGYYPPPAGVPPPQQRYASPRNQPSALHNPFDDAHSPTAAGDIYAPKPQYAAAPPVLQQQQQQQYSTPPPAFPQQQYAPSHGQLPGQQTMPQPRQPVQYQLSDPGRIASPAGPGAGGAEAPFPVMTASGGAGERPRGVQLRDG